MQVIAVSLNPSGRLGHSPHGGSGWCSLKIEQESRSTGILITVLGNDLWIYLTVVVVTVLYLTTHCHIKHHAYVSERCYTEGLYRRNVCTQCYCIL